MHKVPFLWGFALLQIYGETHDELDPQYFIWTESTNTKIKLIMLRVLDLNCLNSLDVFQKIYKSSVKILSPNYRIIRKKKKKKKLIMLQENKK